MENENQNIEAVPLKVQEASFRAEVDIQVNTAMTYPRDIEVSLRDAIQEITLDEEAAETAGYKLNRAGESIEGKSINLATIAATHWGNLRIKGYVKEIEHKQVVAVGECWDIQKNIGCQMEVRRSIWSGKKNKRYSDDMINMTCQAAIAIARRNAILAVVPKHFTDKLYNAAKDKLRGELQDEKTLRSRRTRMFNWFEKHHNVPVKTILGYLKIDKIDDIDADMLLHMTQVKNGITSGDVDVMEEFGLKKQETEKQKDKKLFSDNEPAGE